MVTLEIDSVLKFTILQKPESTQHGKRHCIIYVKGKPVIKEYNAPEVTLYVHNVKLESKQYAPTERPTGPVKLYIAFLFDRPQYLEDASPDRIPLFTQANGDWDNLVKGTQDAMAEAGFWKNDGQIWSGTGEKFYSETGLIPRMEVEITYYKPYEPKPRKRTAGSAAPKVASFQKLLDLNND